MKHYESKWNVLCCDGSYGACLHCSAGTMAYVLGGTGYQGGRYVNVSWTWVRFCPDGFGTELSDTEVGLVIYHELMHVTSAATDHGYGKQ